MGLYAFFELRSMRLMRWTVVVVLVCLGIGIFLRNLDDLRSYEATCHDPVNVEAVIAVEPDGRYYDKYLSYTYDGILYDRVFYYSTKSADVLREEGDAVTISLDPRNPGELAVDMVDVEAVYLAVILTAVGMALGVYCLALQNNRFYDWRVRKAWKRNACGPDYAKDVFLIALLLTFLMGVVMALIWPTACGAMAFILTLLCGLAFIFVPFYEKFALK